MSNAAKVQPSAKRVLAREKVLQNIYEAPPEMRSTLKKWLNRSITARRGSDSFAREHPNATHVTDQQCVLMARAHQKGDVSFRALEVIFHLVPNAGNGAQRCVNRGLAIIRSKARTAPAKRELVTA